MEFTLEQTKARCGNIRGDNAYECYRPMGHIGFHACKKGANLWLDLDELPRTWAHSTMQIWHDFWMAAANRSESRVMLT